MSYIAGVDIGGTNTKIGIVDEEGEILVKKSIKTLSLEGAEKTMTRIWETIRELLSSLNIDEKDLKGVGMGIPGPVMNKKVVGFFANFHGKETLTFHRCLKL